MSQSEELVLTEDAGEYLVRCGGRESGGKAEGWVSLRSKQNRPRLARSGIVGVSPTPPIALWCITGGGV